MGTSTRLPREVVADRIAEMWAGQSTCPRASVGCVIMTPDFKHVLAHGYNGAPSGLDHCLDAGCDPDPNDPEGRCTRAIHAEENAIIWAARRGIPIQDSALVCTHSPCQRCAKMVIASGIQTVRYTHEYSGGYGSLRLLMQSGIYVEQS